MAKTIEFDYEQNHYTLEFTRKTVEQMEQRGFDVELIGSKPMTYLPMLFEGAFLAHHRNTKKAIIDIIYSKLPDKEKLWDALAEMYMEPVSTLMDEPEEGDEGNIVWGANW